MGAVIVLPILYGCTGFVMTLLMAALYNVSARIAGGVEIDVNRACRALADVSTHRVFSGH